MKLISYVLLLLFIMMAGCEKSAKKQKIEEAIALELKHYPEAALRDIYKNFFQDAFGPGHAIPDTAVAMRYLKHELGNAEQFDTLMFQPLGYQHRYYRVNLVLVKEDKIPLDAYFEAFVQSAREADPPTMDEWRGEWAFIMDVVEDMDLDLSNYEKDRQFLDSLLANGKYVVHHSQQYVNKYHPHYRIVGKKYIEELKGYWE
ncbi:MAG: hypothetical protein K9I94_14530 [Bacteroidales bacterium]|nr:hypothetical protein [Bacteroidales bacterium]